MKKTLGDLSLIELLRYALQSRVIRGYPNQVLFCQIALSPFGLTSKALSKDLGMPRDTVLRRLQYLEDCGLINRVRPEASRFGQVGRPACCFFINGEKEV